MAATKSDTSANLGVEPDPFRDVDDEEVQVTEKVSPSIMGGATHELRPSGAHRSAGATIWKMVIPRLLPWILGNVAFFAIVGHKILDVTNTKWLMLDQDGAQHLTGWLFFRNSPWAFPLGANPDFGLELANSIFYSDSIPIFAFIFKFASPLLPEEFQYFGLWIWLCFLLQSWFAWKLIGLFCTNFFIRSCATGFFLLSPPMLFRLYGHDSLVGHWIILAGLLLCLSRDANPWLKWLALCIISSLVHSYLLAMVLLLWVSDTIRRRIEGASLQTLLREYLIVGLGTFAALFQAGFFLVDSGKAASGFGFFRMNINSLINPYPGMDGASWSYVLPHLPTAPGDYEGFNYLGLGLILLLLVAVAANRAFRHVRIKLRWTPLLCACCVLVALAITNNVGIGTLGFTLPIPEKALTLFSLVRSSGRMFWPVFYLLLLGAIYLLVHSYKERTAAILIALALFVQVVDTSAGWASSREKAHRDWESRFGPEWEQIASNYTRIRMIPPGPSDPRHTEIAYFAAKMKMPTDAAYLARVDDKKRIKSVASAFDRLEVGNLEIDSLYIIAPNYAHLAFLAADQSRDLLIRLDGFIVLAPNWWTLDALQKSQVEGR